MDVNTSSIKKNINSMKNMNKLKLTFTSLALAVPLAMRADDPPQTGKMMPDSMMATNQPQMNSMAQGNMETNSMTMPGSSMRSVKWSLV